MQSICCGDFVFDYFFDDFDFTSTNPTPATKRVLIQTTHLHGSRMGYITDLNELYIMYLLFDYYAS